MTTLARKSRLIPSVLCLLLLAAPEAEAQSTNCPVLGDALVEHSCFHARFGPFTTVLATSGDELTPETPSINAVHTEYRVGLAGPTSSVTYTPVRSGTWTMFRGTDVAVRLFHVKEGEDGKEDELLPTSEVHGDTGCEALPLASAFQLEKSELYRIELGPSNADHVIAVLEYLDDFLIENGRDDDGDGYGRSDDVVVTACAPPAGYAQNAQDCDDENPNVHPGATEICDGIDQNCNGLVDDEGLTCRAGEGACLAVGTTFCPEEGAIAECGATSASPSPEVCNGLDDDCDGEIDNDPELCPEWDAPTCVRQAKGAFCGCLLDLDCGSRESGFICDTDTRRCLPGCSTSPGHNGCSSGEKCDESTTPGSCVKVVIEPPEGDGDGDRGDGDDDDDEPEREFQPAEPSCGCHVVGAAPAPVGAPLLGALALFLLALRRRCTEAPHLTVAKPKVSLRAKHRLLSLFTLLLMVGALLGCGGRAEETGNPNSEPDPSEIPSNCVPALDSSVVGHSCSHITNGPFVIVVPTSSPADAPDVSRVHTPYDVDVLETPSELEYNPKRDGQHVVFLGDAEVEISIYKGDTEVRTRRFPVEGCHLVEKGISAEFELGESYRFIVPRTAGSPFLLFVEHLGTFGDRAWESDCE